MKGSHKRTIAIGALAAIGALIVVGTGFAQDRSLNVKALGGEQFLNSVNVAPDVSHQSTPDGGFGRAYRQQPPLIPHKVDRYQITLTNNACMKCHDWPGNIEVKAPKVSETHYVDRQGARLDKIAGTRYFCQQCHVPQEDARPLVENEFQNSTEVK
jgi:nitrate reductase (cytochrome), electron transfer subunit